MTPLVRKLIDILEEQELGTWSEYRVPGAWVDAATEVAFPSAASYHLHQLRRIDDIRRSARGSVQWKIQRAVAYNCLVRNATSYNHGPGVAGDGYRTTGTFLKLVSLLPYLRRMGVDTLILLPITEISEVGKKGTLGSPYAVKHPFRLDPLLAEPAVEMSVEDQARVLIELCHLIGMKVVLEVVLRTAGIDSDLAQHHPEWFYWIDTTLLTKPYSAPVFSDEQVKAARTLIESGTRTGLPAPNEDYQVLFDHMPMRVEKDELGWKGIGPRQKVLRIPPAFADWPPDDPQPPWSDVTYLRLHDHPSFRYMAYNTIRMFESELDQEAYRQTTLWNMLSGIIPHYVRMFGIDGAMIDMGHALPAELRKRIISQAREARANIILLEENFELNAQSAAEGYNAILGYLPFDGTSTDGIRAFVQRVAQADIPVRYMATPESHNTPRAASRLPARGGAAAGLFLSLLPWSLSVLHAGIELDEELPVNTGLGFTPEELENYSESELALFSDVPLPWLAGRGTAEWLANKRAELQRLSLFQYLDDTDLVVPVETGDEDVVAFMRIPKGFRRGVVVVLSTSGVSKTVQIQRQHLPGVNATAAMRGVLLLERELVVDLAGPDVRIIPVHGAFTSVAPTTTLAQ